jgi:sec-independent protein translocase protein TatA
MTLREPSGRCPQRPDQQLIESDDKETQMFLRGLEGWHIVIIVALIAVLFGAKRMPDAARSFGQSLRIFKAEMKASSTADESEATRAPDPVAHPAPMITTSEVAGPTPAQNIESVPASRAGTPAR